MGKYSKEFTFISKDGQTVSYDDVCSGKFKVKHREDYETIQRLGGNGWEYAAYSEEHRGPKGRTAVSDYITCTRKQTATKKFIQHFKKSIPEQYHPNKEKKVLELGCNLGRNLLYFKNEFRCPVVGVDINHDVIETCRQAFKPNMPFMDEVQKDEFYVLDLKENLDWFKQFKDNEFAVTILFEFLYSFEDGDYKQQFINEVSRISECIAAYELYDPSRALAKADALNQVQSYAPLSNYTDKEIITYLCNDPRTKHKAHQFIITA